MNEYLPRMVTVSRRIDEAPEIYTLELGAKNEGKSGQFYMLSVQGVGEAPIQSLQVLEEIWSLP